MKTSTMMKIAVSTGLALAVVPAFAQNAGYPAIWTKPFPAHRVIGNVYYVGSEDLAVYLITSDTGHILINSNLEESVPQIRASVEKLGFRFTDVKILLGSHAHVDHMAGHAAIKKLTGAQVLVMQGDEGIIRSGGQGDFQYDSHWAPCTVDRVIHDGEQVKLGGNTLVAHHTPGHTRGCTTWTIDVTDNGKVYHAVIVGSPNVNAGYRIVNNAKYPTIAEDYARSFQIWKSLPCDVFLGAHGAYYGMAAKFKRNQENPNGNAFVDPPGYRAYIEEREQAYRKELARQRGQ